jgi:glycosyltransferase involved in cell wall biosynthesis
MKKISIIIPVYGVERYIQTTVQSVLDQTYQNFELILVDDGSPDRSIEICQQFQDPRIHILHQANRGASAARNQGIRQAQGDYLSFLDGDDVWLPEKLAKHVAHLERAPEVGLSFSRSAFIDEAGQALGIYQMPKLEGITKSHMLCRNPVGNGSAAVIRREAFEAIKFQDDYSGIMEDCYWDERLKGAQDYDCWLRIACLTDWQIAGIPEVLTLYRLNSGGISANLLNHSTAWRQVIEKLRGHDPALIAAWGKRAEAYYLRYLARRAVSLQSGSVAVNLVHQALGADWRIALEEPRRTGMTIAAAYLLFFLPKSFYSQMEALAMKMTGATQRQKILAAEAQENP